MKRRRDGIGLEAFGVWLSTFIVGTGVFDIGTGDTGEKKRKRNATML